MLSTLALLAPLALPQEPEAELPYLDLYFAGVPALLEHEKDAGLRALLAPVPGHLRELILAEDEEMRVLGDLLIEVWNRSARMRIEMAQEADMAEMLPFRYQLELHGIPEEVTAALVAGVDGAFGEDQGAPEKTKHASGLAQRADGNVQMLYGQLGPDALISLGPHMPTGVPTSPALPEGARRVAVVRVDPEQMYKNIFGLFFLFMFGERELPNWYYALFGGLEISAAVDLRDDVGLGTLKLTQLGRAWEEVGILPEHGLGAEQLARVPADARLALLWAVSPEGLLDGASLFVDEAMEDQALVNDLDFLGDLAASNLGERGGLWLADSTGGLDVTALVAFHELAPDADVDALFTSIADALPEELRAQRIELGGAPALSIQFPGLPVPIEPTLAARDGMLWFALQPSNLLSAFATSSSLTERVNLDEGALAFAYLDTPALATRGSALLASGLAAAANFMRGHMEVPTGPLMPSTSALGLGARPFVAALRREGEDLVGQASFDPSLTVNLAGFAGLVDQQVTTIAAVALLRSWRSGSSLFGVASEDTWVNEGTVELQAAVAAPPAEAFEDPVPVEIIVTRRRGTVTRDLQALHSAVTSFMLRNGHYPDGLLSLVQLDANGHRYLDRTAVPQDPWGREYLYDPPAGAGAMRLYTLGADGIPGGLGEDKDIELDASYRNPPGPASSDWSTLDAEIEKLTAAVVLESGTNLRTRILGEDVKLDETEFLSLESLGRDPTIGEEEWRRVQDLARVMADDENPRIAKNAGSLLWRVGRPAYPAIVNEMLRIDLATQEGHRQGDFLHRQMEGLLHGNSFGWMLGFEDDPVRAARFNKRIVRAYYDTWAKVLEDDEVWFQLSRQRAKARPVQEEVAELDALGRARQERVRRDMRAIEDALITFCLHNGGQFPVTLHPLVMADANGARYLDLPQLPEDPWEQEYYYLRPKNDLPYGLFTLGADGLPGGVGEDADMTLEDLKR